MKEQTAPFGKGRAKWLAQPRKSTAVDKKGKIVQRRTVTSKKLQAQLNTCLANPESVLFLDIETTGLSHHYDDITLIGWSLAGCAKTLIKGEDVDPLHDAVGKSKVLVTFNGIRFDTKFISRDLPNLALPEIHLDLMYLCRRVGLTGGQKAIEKELGLEFRYKSTNIDGAAAVTLWHRYIRGDLNALRELIGYNRADIAAMGAILDETISRLNSQLDLFTRSVRFSDWSAPADWKTLPQISAPDYALRRERVTFSDLFGNDGSSEYRVVGIDLSGSEKRASGWCVLNGCEAKVETVFSDHDLIEKTIRVKPKLVSIDSPLCLPVGRVSVSDDDPGRKKYGIMRECERELKRRGINVYPCLIKSMQRLTARGIKLANIFRERGVPVIECYPGAAQDIMRIPRKGAGAEWLKAGLLEFGILGDYEKQKVTHDELDAITSALVGTFHLSAMSEELGSESEAPLIIPTRTKNDLPFVVGISGPISAGKTTLARSLEHIGFTYTRFSLVIDDLLRDRQIALTRLSRQEMGNEIHTSGLQQWLCEQTIARVEEAKMIVVDGLRFPEDYACLVEKYGARFLHVYVDADENTRRIRYNAEVDDIGFDEASKADVEQRVSELHPLAHRTFFNIAEKKLVDDYAVSVINSQIGE